MTWQARGVCRGQVNRWQTVQISAPTIAKAKAACLGCPVLTECRTWVMAQDEDPCPWHVVAGLTPDERWSVRYEPGRLVCHA